VLTTLIASVALAGGLPAVDVAWKGDTSLLYVVAPAGEHVAPEAPLRVTIDAGGDLWSYDGYGAAAANGLPCGQCAGLVITGTMSVSLCVDGGSSCRFADVAFSGDVPTIKKGRVSLAVTAPGSDHAAAEGPFKADAAAAAERAFAESAERGVPVLIDFAAVWCPPCDLLEAEILHAAEHEEMLSQYVVLSIDVDDPSSWALKSRYAVSGYPTVVVTQADGTEIGRMEGYSGEDTTATWLGDLADGAAAAATTPAAAARRAWSLFQLGQDEAAAAALTEAAGAEETEAFRLTRVVTAPNLDDVRWLTEHAPETGADWIFYAEDLAETDEGKVALTVAIEKALPHTEAAPAADLLYTMGNIVGEPHARTWYAASATMLHAAFTGDPDRDRGHYTWYAQLLDHAGQTDAGLAFLEDARRAYPDEPTWALTGGRILLKRGLPADALTWIDRDLGTAWGDNLIRLATQRVEALQALDRGDEAKTYAAQVLAANPVPPEELGVRTGKYRQKLEDLVRDETAENDAP